MRKFILSSLFIATSLAFAGQEIGMAPETVYQMKITEEEPVLFIDVRDPVEIMFVGGTDMVDLNIPYMIVDRDSWNEERGTFELNLNPDFAKEVAQALADRNLPKDTLIITMCRSGSERGEPSAEALRKAGFPNAHYVVNGFQGDAIATGNNKGFRTQNGWQNSTLPWTPKVDGDKIYRGSSAKEMSKETDRPQETTPTSPKAPTQSDATDASTVKTTQQTEDKSTVSSSKSEDKQQTNHSKKIDDAKLEDRATTNKIKAVAPTPTKEDASPNPSLTQKQSVDTEAKNNNQSAPIADDLQTDDSDQRKENDLHKEVDSKKLPTAKGNGEMTITDKSDNK